MSHDIQWPTDPEQQAALARAFDEGEYWFEAARDKLAVLKNDLYKARQGGDADRIALLEEKCKLARVVMERLRGAAIRPS